MKMLKKNHRAIAISGDTSVNDSIPPVVSDLDDNLTLDPAKFLKEMPKLRAKSMGREIKVNHPDEHYFSVPTFKSAVIREYSKIPKSFKKKALLMYSQGCSDAEVMSTFGISPQAWHSWIQEHAEFAEFLEIGNNRAKAWWERVARQYVSQSSSKFNSGLWFMNMKNNFGYKDEKKVEHTGEVQHGFVLLPPQEGGTTFVGQTQEATYLPPTTPVVEDSFVNNRTHHNDIPATPYLDEEDMDDTQLL